VQFLATECVIRRYDLLENVLIILDKPVGRTGTSLEGEAGAIGCDRLEPSLGRGHCARIRWWPEYKRTRSTDTSTGFVCRAGF
jgi:hypothetical protein